MNERIGLTIRLDPDLHEQLRTGAYHSRMNLGTMAAEIIRKHFEEHPPSVPQPQLVQSGLDQRSKRALNRSKNKKKKKR